MFFGEYKARRTINLGGNKQQVSKQELLLKSQYDRQQREQERLRTRAYETIAKWWKGRLAKQSVLYQIQHQFNLNDPWWCACFVNLFHSRVEQWLDFLLVHTQQLLQDIRYHQALTRFFKYLVQYPLNDKTCQWIEILFSIDLQGFKRLLTRVADDCHLLQSISQKLDSNPTLIHVAAALIHDKPLFCHTVLSWNNLPLLPVDDMSKFLKVFNLDEFLNDLQLDSFPSELVPGLLGNLIVLGYNKRIGFLVRNIQIWCEFVANLLQKMPNEYFPDLTDVDETGSQVDPKLKARLELLGDSQLWMRLQPLLVEHQFQVGYLLSVCLNRFSNKRIDLLARTVTDALLSHYFVSLELKSIEQFNDLFMWKLNLVCEFLRFSLLMIGDDEFCKFNLDFIGFSGWLKNIAYRMWSNDLHLEFRELITKLVQLLYDRDSRIQFCPPNHWLIDIDLAEFLSRLFSIENNKQIDLLFRMPFVIPFETRVGILRKWIQMEKQELGLCGWIEPVAKARVRRGFLFQDGFDQLSHFKSRLKGRVAIEFISKQGYVEHGIDGGGVFKEFLTGLAKEAFDTNHGLFRETLDQKLYPNPQSISMPDIPLSFYTFLGIILGKSLYEGILVELYFAPFFLSKWLGRKNYLDDLPFLDKELYQGLLFVKNYQGNVQDLSLFFAIDEQAFGQSKTVDLCPNGQYIPVTNENKLRYIYSMADYKLNYQIQQQCQAFLQGLESLISLQWLKLFSVPELQILLSGTGGSIDVDDFKKNVEYSGAFSENHPTILLFWQVVEHELTMEQIKLLVKFITSCSRPPLLGFSELVPKLTIRDSTCIQEWLPSASTCVNLLKMPIYKDKQVLKEKLIYAIEYGSGFELS